MFYRVEIRRVSEMIQKLNVVCLDARYKQSTSFMMQSYIILGNKDSLLGV